MDAVNLFSLASQHSKWLSVRQAAIAGNIANAQTPGYKARDTADFENVLNTTSTAMRVTHPMHTGSQQDSPTAHELTTASTWETSHSGNSVRLEQELLRASSVNRAMQLNTAAVQSFHRMLAAAVRG